MRFGIKKRDNILGSDLEMFRKSISNLFDEFFSLKPTGFFDADWMPAVDVREDSKGVYVTADIPGIDEKNLEVNIEDNILTIKGERFEEHKGGDDKRAIISERSYGAFQRSITLPRGVKGEEAKAEFKNGVLRITIPREKQVEIKKIKISAK